MIQLQRGNKVKKKRKKKKKYTTLQKKKKEGLLFRANGIHLSFGGQQKRDLLVDVFQTMQQVTTAAVLTERRQSISAAVFIFVDDGHGAHQRAQNQFHVIAEVVHLHYNISQ